MKIVTGENNRGDWTGQAVFSAYQRFRCSLLRRWNNASNDALYIDFIMLKPGTADAQTND